MGRTTLHQLVAVMLAFAVMVIGPEVIHRFSTPNESSSLPPPENTPQPSAARAINIQSVPSSPGAIFPPEMAYLLADGEHNDLRHKLTQKAAKDAGRQDEKALAKTLTLLGQAAVESNDLAMAELYFEEALGLHQKTGSVVGVAGVEMSLGLVHLTHRRVAVAAGTSYDRLLVARWKVSHGQLQEAQGEVLDIIRDELKLDRYAAAANAVNTLVRIHKASGDNYLAKDAVVQAMDLYTRAGQTSRAQESFAQLEELGVNETELESIHC